jgi:HSP20 family protein
MEEETASSFLNLVGRYKAMRASKGGKEYKHNLYRTGDHYVLHADLPGVDPGSVDVSVDNGTLTIRAERSARSDESVQWISSERFTGTYLRQLSLGDGVDANGINATYENGVLTVTIPLAEVAKPRRIEVQASTTGSVVSAPANQAQVTSS